MQPAANPLIEMSHQPSEHRRVSQARRESLARMGGLQDVRGITLKELKELRDKYKMTEQRWFCANNPDRCKHSEPFPPRPPVGDPASPDGPVQQRAVCPKCKARGAGTVRTRNLYELMDQDVKRLLEEEKMEISYVEYLMKKDQRKTGRKVKTFVSHWWGEEFKDLVASLDRYATSRCILQQRLRLWTTLHSVGTLLLNVVLLLCLPWGVKLLERGKTQHVGLICLQEPGTALWLVAGNALITGLILACLILEGLWNKAQADDWTFWICAFANNQYKLKHALGRGVESSAFALALQGDIQSVVCIIDPRCVIYTRIWCAFELFYVKKVLPKSKPAVPIVLINDKGLISEGGLRTDLMHNIQGAIHNVRTAQAQASKPEDKLKIESYMSREEVSYADLDKTLKELSQVGLDNVELRRRAILIYSFLCPLASYVFSDFFFWCVMEFRPMSPEWEEFKEGRHLHSVTFKMGFYFFASLFALLILLLMVSVSSTEVVQEDEERLTAPVRQVAVDWNEANEVRPAPQPWLARTHGALKSACQWVVQNLGCWSNVKELKIRLAGPSFLSRLQSRVLKKSSMMISALMGPGLTPSLLAGVLLLLLRRSQDKEKDDFRKKVEQALEFLYIVREVWNMVQIVYACLGLVAGCVYWHIRDRKIGRVRSFLEEIIL